MFIHRWQSTYLPSCLCNPRPTDNPLSFPYLHGNQYRPLTRPCVSLSPKTHMIPSFQPTVAKDSPPPPIPPFPWKSLVRPLTRPRVSLSPRAYRIPIPDPTHMIPIPIPTWMLLYPIFIYPRPTLVPDCTSPHSIPV